jgi:hypothetical protein
MRSMVEGFSDLEDSAAGEVADPSTIRFADGPPPHAAHREDLPPPCLPYAPDLAS